ncbi:hypothetical protein [uncultured Maribacter sp.]|uniref:hypothetical protein n=1 Tax=uncultured Maribacter sp. TaxID=431308 RepID=UPI0026296604|nr:hypothetical protein [uncultured Maribacter sp.]
MVKIVDYKTYSREDGTTFCVLIAQGGLETVKSKETGKTYFTARKANVPCTFDESVCASLIGAEIEGTIKKVKVDEYEYSNPDTGEVIHLSHRYEFVSLEDEIVNNHLVEEEIVS